MGFLDKIKTKSTDISESISKKLSDSTSTINDKTGTAVKNIGDWSKSTLDSIGDFAVDSRDKLGRYTEVMKTWTKEMPEKLKDYTADFNIEDFWNKIAETTKKVGQDMIFCALAIFYAVCEFFKNEQSKPQASAESSKAIVRAKFQNRKALGIVNAYQQLNPEITLNDLRKAFPNELATDKGVDEIFITLNEAEAREDEMFLYFTKENEVINLSNGEKVVMCTMWTADSLQKIIDKAEDYGITVETEALSPNALGFTINFN